MESIRQAATVAAKGEKSMEQNGTRILITGAGSYIGTSVERYLQRYREKKGERINYHVDTISLRGESWESCDFSSYNTIFHVAGIAHADVGGVSEETKALYYQVNRDLAVKTAQKARNEGVSQFIYMSSVIVYGDSAPVGKQKLITAETSPAPSNFYGDSKWQAELKLRELETQDFQVAVLRPPMIYGPGSKGNYPLLSRLAGKLMVFPAVRNERSMLYVENLAEFVRLLIDSQKGGVYFPQNAQYSSTAEMVKEIGAVRGRKIRLWKLLNPLVYAASVMPGKIGRLTGKAFGSLTIDQRLSEDVITGYRIFTLEESVRRTEETQRKRL